MNQLITLWKFSRPHTIIGSVISILTLYFIVCDKPETQCLSYLTMALIIGISCNIFIVGINQIADVNIDKINNMRTKLLSMKFPPKTEFSKINFFADAFYFGPYGGC